MTDNLDDLYGYIYLTDSILGALSIIPDQHEGLKKVKKKNI